MSVVSDLIKNPILIHQNHSYETLSEKVLQKLIMEDIVHFLEELGSFYSFVANEYKIRVGDTYNYIDLLFYNIEFKCYVVIELKITELKKEHIGQVKLYMNYIDRHLKTENEKKTVGIILCKKDQKYIIEYCSDPFIFTKEYLIV